MISSFEGHDKIVSRLITAGAKVDTQDEVSVIYTFMVDLDCLIIHCIVILIRSLSIDRIPIGRS